MDIGYEGRTEVVAGFDASPIRQAIDASGRTLVSSIAYLISFLVAAVPWIPIIVFVVWLVRRGMRRWRAEKAAATGP